ncbi:MAG TPA: hypothetical protein ENG00_01095 [Candidatus Aenigmarchaeota archaeon]|nr:hypothetical protein [Candidatus Aenigmarchaeota archaeon]
MEALYSIPNYLFILIISKHKNSMKPMDLNLFASRHCRIIIFLSGFLISLLPSIIRWYVLGIPCIVGFPTFYHRRIAEEIISGNFDWYDDLSFGGRPYTYPPLFSFSLALFGSLLGIDLGGTVFLPFLVASLRFWSI